MQRGPSIPNLLFADDSLILMKANMENAQTLKRILDLYCAASAQLVSLDKSSIFFSPNTNVNVKAQICALLDIMTEALNDKYLGLPSKVWMDKTDCFQYLIDRVMQRVNGWKERQLSLGGKEILLKLVAQAIPSYAMSVLKFLNKFVKEYLTRCRTIGGGQ